MFDRTEREVTIYNYDLTEGRKRHYEDAMNVVLKGFRRTTFSISKKGKYSHLTFKSTSEKEWSKLNKLINEPYDD